MKTERVFTLHHAHLEEESDSLKKNLTDEQSDRFDLILMKCCAYVCVPQSFICKHVLDRLVQDWLQGSGSGINGYKTSFIYVHTASKSTEDFYSNAKIQCYIQEIILRNVQCSHLHTPSCNLNNLLQCLHARLA